MNANERIQNRMKDLDELLAISYEKLGYFQKELAITSSPTLKFELKKKISSEIIPPIKTYETEYAKLLADKIKVAGNRADERAKEILPEIQEAISSLKEAMKEKQSDGLTESIKKAQEAIEKPMTSAGKLQAVIPIIPGIISYELELDIYSTLTGLWEKLKGSF